MRAWIWVSGCFSLTGCGDGLVSGDYQGDPLVTIIGEVLHDTPMTIEVDHPVIGLFWRDVTGQLQAEQSGSVDTHFPARYSMSLFLPPVAGVLQPQPVFSGVEGALGLLMLYQDENEDGQWAQTADPVIGVSHTLIAWFSSQPEGMDLAIHHYVSPLPPCDQGQAEDAPSFLTLHADLLVDETCMVMPDLDCDPVTNDWPEICSL